MSVANLNYVVVWSKIQQYFTAYLIVWKIPSIVSGHLNQFSYFKEGFFKK